MCCNRLQICAVFYGKPSQLTANYVRVIIKCVRARESIQLKAGYSSTNFSFICIWTHRRRTQELCCASTNRCTVTEDRDLRPKRYYIIIWVRSLLPATWRDVDHYRTTAQPQTAPRKSAAPLQPHALYPKLCRRTALDQRTSQPQRNGLLSPAGNEYVMEFTSSVSAQHQWVNKYTYCCKTAAIIRTLMFWRGLFAAVVIICIVPGPVCKQRVSVLCCESSLRTQPPRRRIPVKRGRDR